MTSLSGSRGISSGSESRGISRGLFSGGFEGGNCESGLLAGEVVLCDGDRGILGSSLGSFSGMMCSVSGGEESGSHDGVRWVCMMGLYEVGRWVRCMMVRCVCCMRVRRGCRTVMRDCSKKS